MRGSVQNALRWLTRAMRPLALRSAGKEGSSTSVVRHVGRRSGRTYEVDRPEVIPMAEATAYFRPREQRMHRQFHVDSALQVRRLESTG